MSSLQHVVLRVKRKRDESPLDALLVEAQAHHHGTKRPSISALSSQMSTLRTDSGETSPLESEYQSPAEPFKQPSARERKVFCFRRVGQGAREGKEHGVVLHTERESPVQVLWREREAMLMCWLLTQYLSLQCAHKRCAAATGMFREVRRTRARMVEPGTGTGNRPLAEEGLEGVSQGSKGAGASGEVPSGYAQASEGDRSAGPHKDYQVIDLVPDEMPALKEGDNVAHATGGGSSQMLGAIAAVKSVPRLLPPSSGTLSVGKGADKGQCPGSSSNVKGPGMVLTPCEREMDKGIVHGFQTGDMSLIKAALSAGVPEWYQRMQADGTTALMAAAYHGDFDFVRHLVAQYILKLKPNSAAALSTADNNGNTAKDLANQRGHTQVVALLEAHAPHASPVVGPAPKEYVYDFYCLSREESALAKAEAAQGDAVPRVQLMGIEADGEMADVQGDENAGKLHDSAHGVQLAHLTQVPLELQFDHDSDWSGLADEEDNSQDSNDEGFFGNDYPDDTGSSGSEDSDSIRQPRMAMGMFSGARNGLGLGLGGVDSSDGDLGEGVGGVSHYGDESSGFNLHAYESEDDDELEGLSF
ncbi:unnamed protein product [Chrysoparadoxa australica]